VAKAGLVQGFRSCLYHLVRRAIGVAPPQLFVVALQRSLCLYNAGMKPSE
jgi:hypothetical protein